MTMPTEDIIIGEHKGSAGKKVEMVDVASNLSKYAMAVVVCYHDYT